MKNSYFLFFALSCLLFLNCKNEKATPANATPATPSFIPSGVKTADEGFYKHLKGKVDTFAITMDLVQIKNRSTDFGPYNKTINQALANAVRRYFKMKANEPLSNNLFDNSIKSSNNFSEIKSVVNPRFL